MIVQIRLATIADIPALRELIPESVRALGADYYSAKQIESALSIFGLDTQLILDQTYFVAEVENQIAGSGGWSKRSTLYGSDQSKRGQADNLLDPATDAARIRAFYVHPQWSRKGVASRILASCEEAARQAGFARVELVASLSGKPLYSAHGYEPLEAVHMETPDGESLAGLRMTKSLAS